jgi:hypothetical protein
MIVRRSIVKEIFGGKEESSFSEEKEAKRLSPIGCVPGD